MICALAPCPCRVLLPCGVRPPCAFDGVSALLASLLRAQLLSAFSCAAFLPIRFRFLFKTLGNFPARCLVLNSRSLL